MLQIAICDDVVEQTLMLQAYIRDYCEKSHAEYKMHIFVSGEELVSEVERFDIVFLDIEMPGLDGIDPWRIIMATVMVERMREAFFIEAFRFIVKPFERAEVEEALDACMRRVLGSSNISLFCDRIEYIIHQSEIRYVVTYDSYCEYRVKDKVLRSEDSLKKLEQTLDRRLFFRINRKYIVNMAQVKRYKNGVLHLDDLEISVSRRRKKDFEQAFMEFDLRYR